MIHPSDHTACNFLQQHTLPSTLAQQEDVLMCRKPRLMHAVKKLTISEKNALKRVLNDFQYVCGTILQDIQSDERNSDLKVIEKVFCRENIACANLIEFPYYSCRIYRTICIYCGEFTEQSAYTVANAERKCCLQIKRFILNVFTVKKRR